MAKLKKWADGKEFYTKGIAVLTGPNKWEKGEDPEAERRKEVEIEEACYTNRALCNLELSTGALTSTQGSLLTIPCRELPIYNA